MVSIVPARREVGEFRKSYKWMVLCVFLSFTLIWLRAFQLQILEHGKYHAIAQDNITRTLVLPASRGVIRDANGEVVATNVPSFDVFLTPHLIDTVDGISRLSDLLELSDQARADLEMRLHAVSPSRRNHRIEMFRNISREQLASLETHSGELRGVDVIARPMRRYPGGPLGAHAIGYLNEVNAEDLEELRKRGYGAGDRVGRGGIERAYERALHGRKGQRQIIVDLSGGLGGRSRERVTKEVPPVPGNDLKLSLDMKLMREIARAFRQHASGALVAIDVKTGWIRALFSKPSYDLNIMSGRLTVEQMRELEQNHFRPMIDKTLYATYYPGSTFKPFSAVAALEESIVNGSTRYECTGRYTLGNRYFRCTHVHGEVNLRSALASSCNIYFYKIAEQLDLDRLSHFSQRLGFGKPTGIGINTESSGFIPTKQFYTRRDHRFRLGHALNAVIGQGDTRVTLIQLAAAYAALVNGGRLYRPQLVEKILEPDGTTVRAFGPKLKRRLDFSSKHLDLIRTGLFDAVNSEEGTAYQVRPSEGVQVAGKTGTAQVANRKARPGDDPEFIQYLNRDHAWFVGFAPASDPELAVVALVEHGGGGGKYAAPIAVEVLQAYYAH